MAVVLYSGPPFTRKLNDRPQYPGAWLSLQIFRSPTVPPAGASVKVTIVSLVAVEPGGTKTTPVRFGKSAKINRRLGRVVMLVTSVGGLLWSSTTGSRRRSR